MIAYDRSFETSCLYICPIVSKRFASPRQKEGPICLILLCVKSPCLNADDAIGGGSDDFSDVVFDLEPETSEVEESEATEEAPETTEDTTEVETVAETPAYMKLKYNHEERDYTEEEVRTLSQKGLNYEKVFREITSSRSRPETSTTQ